MAPVLLRGSLRRWAVTLGIHALSLAFVVVRYVPWQVVWASSLVLALTFLEFVSAIQLFRGKRSGYFLALGVSSVWLVLCLVITAGLLGSAAYLSGVYGDLGEGAAIAALLLVSGCLQLLGLVPLLVVGRLLSRDFRARFDVRPLPRWLGFGSGGALVLALGLGHSLGSFPAPPAPWTEGQRREIALTVRAALSGSPAVSSGVGDLSGPLHVSAWKKGKLAARVVAEGDLRESLPEAASELARRVRKKLGDDASEGVTLTFERVIGEKVVPGTGTLLVALSVDPGRDGLRRGQRTLLADDLVRAQRFGSVPLVSSIPELRFGMDAKAVLADLGAEGPLVRIRTERFADVGGRVLGVERGNTRAAEGPGAWRAAALLGGDYIRAQLESDGRFRYRYRPHGQREPRSGDYSLARHAGTVYALSELSRLTGNERYLEAARRGATWLDERVVRCGKLGGACIPEDRVASLGAAALGAAALLEYQRATGERTFEKTAKGLLDFVLAMQKKSGDFYHRYHVKKGEVRHAREMFASEEAALALVLGHAVLGRATSEGAGARGSRYLDAARRALDWQVGPKYDFFLGHFMHGADHWTCIAAREAAPFLGSERYLDFCLSYVAFLRRLQFAPGEVRAPDFTGHYGFGAFTLPQAPAAAGFGEAVAATAELLRQSGRRDPKVEKQLALGLDALARDQIRDDGSWLMVDAPRARGGIRRSLVESEVRIDFTQHAVSALVRGAAWAEKGAQSPGAGG